MSIFSFDKFCDKWIGQTVTFTLLGKKITGEVKNASIGGNLEVEFREDNKWITVSANSRAFKIIDSDKE